MRLNQFFSHREKYLPLCALLWIVTVVTLYWFRFPLPQLRAVNPYPSYALTLWVGLVATAAGIKVLRRCQLAFHTQAEELVFGAALGLAVIAYLVLGLGLLHLLYRWVAYGLLGLLTLLTIQDIRRILSIVRYYLTRSYHPSAADLIFGGILLFQALYHLAGTLVPPVFFDSLVYHLALPKLYVLTHGIEYYPYNFFSNFPFTLEMLYTLGLLLRGPIVVKALNYLIHLLMLAGLYLFVRRYISQRSALVSMVIFYTIPWVGITSFLLYVDVGLGCYFWLAMYAFINWTRRRESGWLLLSGALGGVMLGIKYLGVHGAGIIGLSLLGVVLWQYRAQRHAPSSPSLWTALHPIWLFVLPLILVGGPWYLKNLIWTGNPVYPFVFGGRDWDLTMVARYMSYFHDTTGTVHSLWGFLTLPWDLTFNSAAYNIPTGPIVLAGLPLLLCIPRLPALIKYFAAVSVLFVIGWANSSQQSRFLIPLFPFLSVLVAYVFVERLTVASASSGSWRALLKPVGMLLLAAILCANVAWEIIYIQSVFAPFKVIMGLETEDDYLSRQLPTLYPISRYANEHLPPSAKIMYIGETRGYYSDRPFIANTAHDKTPIVDLARQAVDAADLKQRIQALGVTHIILNRREAARLQPHYHYLRWAAPEDEAKFWTFYRDSLKLLHTVNDSELLEIVKRP